MCVFDETPTPRAKVSGLPRAIGCTTKIVQNSKPLLTIPTVESLERLQRLCPGCGIRQRPFGCLKCQPCQGSQPKPKRGKITLIVAKSKRQPKRHQYKPRGKNPSGPRGASDRRIADIGLCECGKLRRPECIKCGKPAMQSGKYWGRHCNACYTNSSSKGYRQHVKPACEQCGWSPPDISALDVDHIISRSRGGTNHFSNLQTLCPNCHRLKTLAEQRWESQAS